MDVKQAIENKNTVLRNAYDRGDSAGCAAVFLEDAVMLPPGQPMVRGREAIRELIQGWIDNIGGTMSNPMKEFGVEGDLAYQVGTYALSGANPPEQGKFVNILKRQSDGTWKVSVAIFNRDKQ